MPKPWYQSRTIWANLIAGVIEVVAVVGSFPGADVIAQWLPPVTAILNILLRRLTSEPIAGTAAAAKDPASRR